MTLREIVALNDREASPIRLAVLARAVGLSAQKLRNDVRLGYLKADKIVAGRFGVYVVWPREAKRYLLSLGLVRVKPANQANQANQANLAH